MQEPLQCLLEGAIDYAGMFPPAELSLEASWLNYRSYAEDEDTEWLLGRLVLPIQALKSFHPDPQHSVELTIAGSGGKTWNDWKSNLDSDAEIIRTFTKGYGEFAPIEGYETKVPTDTWFEGALGMLKTFPAADRYVELTPDSELTANLEKIAHTEQLFAKLRTGGATPDSIPTPEQLAFFIQQAIQFDVPFKLTAGLHHAVPNPAAAPPVVHGFLNVFLASCLCLKEDLTAQEIEEILRNTDVSAFSISETEIAWRDLTLEEQDIEDGRELIHGFGSCSIDEPKDDLRALGLW